MRIALTDLETTGLNPLKHEIIELGCVIFDNETFEIYGNLNFKIKPEHIEDADPKALACNGYKEEDWEDSMTLRQALSFYAQATEGCTFMAHNVTFDYSFIVASFAKVDLTDSLKLGKYKIDTMSVAWAKIPHDKVFSFSLKTLCIYLGIPPEPAIHRAINGATCAYGVYKKLMEMK